MLFIFVHAEKNSGFFFVVDDVVCFLELYTQYLSCPGNSRNKKTVRTISRKVAWLGSSTAEGFSDMKGM